MSDHCKDCCCARSWEALGVTTYTGMSIVEHIERLRVDSEKLAGLELAAWDLHEAVTDALDNPEDVSHKTIRQALNDLGELLPAHRPTDREDAANGTR